MPEKDISEVLIDLHKKEITLDPEELEDDVDDADCFDRYDDDDGDDEGDPEELDFN